MYHHPPMPPHRMYDRFKHRPSPLHQTGWFQTKSHFSTLPEDDDVLYHVFCHRAAKRLGDMYMLIRKGQNRTHRWLSEAHLRVLHEYWNSPKFKAKLEKAKASKASLRGGSLHCGGSSIVESTKRRLEKKLKRPPTQEELFKEVHTRKGDKTVSIDERVNLRTAWRRSATSKDRPRRPVIPSHPSMCRRCGTRL